MNFIRHLILTLTLAPTLASAHGGDKPGPHGGKIEMPGAFHTELVLDKDQSAHVYLLDMNFQNSTTKDSSAKVFARAKKVQIPFNCTVMQDHFHCVPTKKYSQDSEIVIKAVREKAVGNDAVYKLPLKFENQTESKSEHSHH
ncbi:hypothetical protein [Bdellovibrio sp. ZAP7]|uniref:hypothetical protein n=1 Tax=Bdellovibrio sp. ZAP7 TaxID=2231053 RepID=UPI001FEEE733|nr:hypothetical protein [Bdellovibrio sp. ZAP7]